MWNIVFSRQLNFTISPLDAAMSSLKFSMHSVFNWKSLHHEHHVNIALDLCPLSPDYFPENVLPWNTKSFTVIVKGRLWLIGLAENCAENAIWAKKVTFLTKNEIILCQITKLDSFIILVLDFLNIFMLLLFFLISWDFILYSSVCTTLLLFKDRVLPAYCW